MKAVALTRYLPIADPASLVDVELPVPEPGRRDLRVRVLAVSVNPVDTKVRAPKDKVEAQPRVLGWDAAGIVDAVGDGVTLFKPSDEVYYAGDITRPGSNAQFQLVDERIAARKPATLGFAAAAALPLTAITAWELLFDRFRIDLDGAQRGKSLLILAGAGGLGSIAIQLARYAGLRVIATASRADSRAWCEALGAEVVDHRRPLAPQIAALGLAQVDYIANFVDVDGYWTQMAELVAPQGHVGLVSEPKGPLAIGDVYKSKSVSIHWEFMYTRSMFQTPDMAEQHRLLARVAALVDAGVLRGTLRETLRPIDAANLRRAHAQLESGSTIGKLVLEGWD